jgi:hypothetical protein
MGCGGLAESRQKRALTHEAPRSALYQPYGEEGLLVADIDITTATGQLAARFRTVS